jgi:hypothetical protein
MNVAAFKMPVGDRAKYLPIVIGLTPCLFTPASRWISSSMPPPPGGPAADVALKP